MTIKIGFQRHLMTLNGYSRLPVWYSVSTVKQ
ncbi:TPA: hypothetical protein N0F65_001936 [Lagenidium giganteum]|uniref:Ribosomal protein S3 n=1 Tax=Lagenidium giganteum TaxID=4803 RepID=A0AAV2YXN3_9STRA|nr:TPA: hypothetical protein N0F65_001936 [Lagenidium giganteum]